MAKTGLGTYSLAFSLASRNDVRSLFQYCIEATIQLDEESLEVLKNKGLYIRPPYISYPEKVQFVHKKIFLSGFTTQKRPLSALEITHLFANFDMNTLVHMLMIGFAQVTDSKDVQKIFFRRQRISEKHKNLFYEKLMDSHLPSSGPWDSGVTQSQKSPFSEKLMLFITALLGASGTGNYGLALAASPRHDIAFLYSRIIVEVGTFAEDIADLLIEKGWLEQPPLSEDRRD